MMISVASYGDKFALVWGGNAHAYITDREGVKTFDTREGAQRAADAINALEEARRGE